MHKSGFGLGAWACGPYTDGMMKIALLGFGEAGQAFALGAGWGAGARAFDVKTDVRATRDAKYADYLRTGVQGVDLLAAALTDATIVLSLVTADCALAAAKAAAAHIARGALFFDMNSVAPQTKRLAAASIDAAGGRYVDVAVMAPVYPAQMAVPLLLSGPHAEAGAAALADIGFANMRCVGDDIGRASTIKMLRSVMYKGVEALTAECLIACAKAGVTDEVLASFGNDWAAQADYRLDRMMVHGVRRAAEMDESAKTLEGLGVEPLMTRGTAARQRAIGALGIASPSHTLTEKLERLSL